MPKFIANLEKFFSFMSKTMLEVGQSFILGSKLYLEGWLSRSSCLLVWPYMKQLHDNNPLMWLLMRKVYCVLAPIQAQPLAIIHIVKP